MYPNLTELFIAGEWRPSADGRRIAVLNPATAEAIGDVAHAGRADLDAALAAAAHGFAVWRRKTPYERAKVMRKAADLMRERADAIAPLMTMEQGKPLAEARGETLLAGDLIDWFAEQGRRSFGQVIPGRAEGVHQLTFKEPVGPVAAFTPWNFPAGSPLRKIAAALAAGCSIVLKASEEVPGTACAIVRCFQDAGVPPGVLNLVFGVPSEISERLIASPIIRFIAFTGSVPVGKHLAGLAAAAMKPTIMELGGHAPVIVCEDADPVQAARASVLGKFINAGQVCTSPSRFLVHESIFDRFTAAFVEGARAVTVGDGMEPKIQMGPLANGRRLKAVEALVADAVERGAKALCGGRRIGDRGFFYAPTVLTGVPDDAQMMTLEPFGPVAPLRPFSDLDEAIAIANRLPYGLAAYGFTRSSATANRLARRLEAGIMSINHVGGSVVEAPSGGVKESGYGREGGHEGLDGYLITKRVFHKYQ